MTKLLIASFVVFVTIFISAVIFNITEPPQKYHIFTVQKQTTNGVIISTAVIRGNPWDTYSIGTNQNKAILWAAEITKEQWQHFTNIWQEVEK